jgi:hypothetical protein
MKTPREEQTERGGTKRPSPAPEPPEPLDAVEQASEESFPASDSPSWAPLHAGTPAKHPDRSQR